MAPCRVFHNHRHSRRVVKKNSPPFEVHPSLLPATRHYLLKANPHVRMLGIPKTIVLPKAAGVMVVVRPEVVQVAATLRDDPGSRNKVGHPPRIEAASRRQITTRLRRHDESRILRRLQAMTVVGQTLTVNLQKVVHYRGVLKAEATEAHDATARRKGGMSIVDHNSQAHTTTVRKAYRAITIRSTRTSRVNMTRLPLRNQAIEVATRHRVLRAASMD